LFVVSHLTQNNSGQKTLKLQFIILLLNRHGRIQNILATHGYENTYWFFNMVLCVFMVKRKKICISYFLLFLLLPKKAQPGKKRALRGNSAISFLAELYSGKILSTGGSIILSVFHP